LIQARAQQTSSPRWLHFDMRRATCPIFTGEGVCSPQPFHEPKGPYRSERESEKCAAGQESRH